MIEGRSDGVSLAWIRSVHHAVEPREIGIPVDYPRGVAGLGDLAADRGGPVPRIGMRGSPLRNGAATLDSRNLVENVEHGRHLVGVVTFLDHVAKAEVVGLPLVIAAKLHEHQLKSGPGEVPVLRRLRAEDHRDAESEPGELLLADLLYGMARGDMADLVAEHRSHLRFVVEVGENPAGEKDGASRQGEGVDHRVIHDRERPGEIGALRIGSEPLTDRIDVILERLVLNQAHFLRHLLGGLLPHLDFLGLADHRELALTRDRIRRAGECQQNDRHECCQ